MIAAAAEKRGGASLTYFQAVVLGAMEGVTELFPVSGPRHAVLFPALAGWDELVKAQSDPESFGLALIVIASIRTGVIGLAPENPPRLLLPSRRPPRCSSW